MAMRNEGSENERSQGAKPDEAMAATNGVDITETVLSVTTIRLTEWLDAPEIG